MNMKSMILPMAMMCAMMAGGSSNGSNGSHFDQPESTRLKPILPRRFNGSIPKGCKLETVPIEIKWNGYHLTQNVEIVFGSEKAKQKAIVKAEFSIKHYLNYRPDGSPKEFGEFDQVELYHL